MKTSLLVSDDLNARVYVWLRQVMDHPAARTQPSPAAPLEDLLARPVPHGEAVALSCRVLEAVVAQTLVLGLAEEYMPSLRIPLPDSPFLVLEPPLDMKTLQASLGHAQLPIVYLVPRDNLKRMQLREQHTRPLPFELCPGGDGLFCSYRTFRAPGEETYLRVVGADFYPESLR